jgi:phage terminase large subunit GpA-like protein
MMKRVLGLMKPPPELTVSQWADRSRYLSPEFAAEPGKWHTDRAEYQRGIMDAVSDPAVQRVVCMKAVQVGWSEVLANSAAFYMCEDPAPTLVIEPNLEMAEAWSKERLAPMIRDTPALLDRVSEAKSRDSGNTIRGKSFPGGFIAIVGANAPAGLASRPIRIVLADEVDKYPVSAGTEGNPLSLAAKRQQTFWNRKTLVGSTPTIKGFSEIEHEYANSDQRRYFVPCPDCGHDQILKWQNVRWDKHGKAHRPETAAYMCEACGSLWDDIQRHAAVAKGKWIAQRPFAGIAGFHVPGLISPWVKLGEIVTEFLEKRHDPERLKTWVNTVLGETWEEKAEKVDTASLLPRREVYGPQSLPDGVVLLVAGVDVHGDRLEMQVLGFGEHEECWGVSYFVIRGDPSQGDVWDALDGLLADSYRTDNLRELHIRSVCIDSGGHHANQVLTYCNARKRRRIFAIKGAAGARPIWPKWSSRTRNNDEVFIVGVDTAKETIHGRLRIAAPGEHTPYVHFPVSEDFNQTYFDQLAAEQVVTRYRDGRPYRVWVPLPGRRNEALDTFVYALAARTAIPGKLVRPKDPARSKDAPLVIKAGAPPPPLTPQQQARRSLSSMLPH